MKFLEKKYFKSSNSDPHNLNLHGSVTVGLDLSIIAVSLTGMLEYDKTDAVSVYCHVLHMP